MDVVCELSVGIAFQHVPSSCPSKKRAFVLERTTARLSHIKVVFPLPECEVKAVYVYVSTTPRLKAFWILLGITKL